jgi:carbon starvation protein
MNTQGKDAGLLARYWDSGTPRLLLCREHYTYVVALTARGLIGATFLYAALVFGVAGTLIGGWSSTGELAIEWPAYKGFTDATGAWLFPFLFITIACGACSGFHSIVASGTTSKHGAERGGCAADRIRPMLLEAMVAVFALASVMILTPGTEAAEARHDLRPRAWHVRRPAQRADDVRRQLRVARFSSFVFDTQDVCTRLGRYVLQEITGLKGFAGGAIATLITLAAPSVYLWNSPPVRSVPSGLIFGTSNQLLAALTLVGCQRVALADGTQRLVRARARDVHGRDDRHRARAQFPAPSSGVPYRP